jgi:hypothetical protein
MLFDPAKLGPAGIGASVGDIGRGPHFGLIPPVKPIALEVVKLDEKATLPVKSHETDLG